MRIIAGEWRGRRLPVPDLPGLRPSGDRSRETLFNWLQPYLPAAVCIDLFAGTGVLGLEALSRGTAQAVLLEKNQAAAENLRSNVALLSASGATVLETDALHWLKTSASLCADLIFVDPPFGLGLQQQALEELQRGEALKVGGLVYVETSNKESLQIPTARWETLKEKRLGEVCMRLLKKNV